MTISDPIGDMLTRIRNAVAVGHAATSMPSSRMKVALAEIMQAEGYIDGFDVVTEPDKYPTLRVSLRYVGERRRRHTHRKERRTHEVHDELLGSSGRRAALGPTVGPAPRTSPSRPPIGASGPDVTGFEKKSAASIPARRSPLRTYDSAP